VPFLKLHGVTFCKTVYLDPSYWKFEIWYNTSRMWKRRVFGTNYENCPPLY